jgi:hypothetical protein
MNQVLPDKEKITMVVAHRPGHRSFQESKRHIELPAWE